MAMSGSGTGALEQLRHGGNSFAYPSAQTAKDFLKTKSFGGDKAAGTFPRAVQYLVDKYPEATKKNPGTCVVTFDGSDIRPSKRIATRGAVGGAPNKNPLEIIGGVCGGDLGEVLDLNTTEECEEMLNELGVPLMAYIEDDSKVDLEFMSKLLAFFNSKNTLIVEISESAARNYEGAMLEYTERNGANCPDYKPKQKTLLEKKFQDELESKCTASACEAARTDLAQTLEKGSAAFTREQLVAYFETLKLVILALVVASTHFLVVHAGDTSGKELVPVARLYYTTMGNEVVSQMVSAVVKFVEDSSGSRLKVRAVAFDGEHNPLRTDTPQGKAAAAVQATDKLAIASTSAKAGNDETAKRARDQVGRARAYGALCSQLIVNSVSAPPTRPAMAYLSNFSTEPTQEPSDEVEGSAVPTLSSAYQKTLLGRFVALPKQASLGEVASFCSKTNTWLVCFGAGVQQRMSTVEVRKHLDDTAGHGAGGSMDVCGQGLLATADEVAQHQTTMPFPEDLDGLFEGSSAFKALDDASAAELHSSTAAMAASRHSAPPAPRPEEVVGHLIDMVKKINIAFPAPLMSVEELPSDPIKGQPLAAKRKMFMSARLRGQLAFVQNEMVAANQFADAGELIADAKTLGNIGLSKQKVTQLRMLCSDRALLGTGLKEDLVARLAEFAATDAGAGDAALREMCRIDAAYTTLANKWCPRLNTADLNRFVANSFLAVYAKEDAEMKTFSDNYHLFHNMVTRIIFNTADPYLRQFRKILIEAVESIGCPTLRSIVHGAVDKHSHAATQYLITHRELPMELRRLGREKEAVLYEVLGQTAQALLRPHKDPESRIDSLQACLILIYRMFGRAARDVGFLRTKGSVLGFTVSQLVNLKANIENQIALMKHMNFSEFVSFKETSLTTRALESFFSRLASNVGSGEKPTQHEVQGKANHLDGMLVIMRQEDRGFEVKESSRKRKVLESSDDGWNDGNEEAAQRHQEDMRKRAKGYTTGHASTRDHNAHAGGQRL